LSYDFKKQLEKWDQQYRVTEKAQQAKDYATEQALNVDRQYGLRQKARNATQDFRLKLPTVRAIAPTYGYVYWFLEHTNLEHYLL